MGWNHDNTESAIKKGTKQRVCPCLCLWWEKGQGKRECKAGYTFVLRVAVGNDMWKRRGCMHARMEEKALELLSPGCQLRRASGLSERRGVEWLPGHGIVGVVNVLLPG